MYAWLLVMHGLMEVMNYSTIEGQNKATYLLLSSVELFFQWRDISLFYFYEVVINCILDMVIVKESLYWPIIVARVV